MWDADYMKEAIKEARMENARGDSMMKHAPKIHRNNAARFITYGYSLAMKTRVVEVGLQRLYKLPWCEPRKALIAEIHGYRMRADTLIDACRKVMSKSAR